METIEKRASRESDSIISAAHPKHPASNTISPGGGKIQIKGKRVNWIYSSSEMRGFVRLIGLDHYIIISTQLFVITVRRSHFFPAADRLITPNYFRSVLKLISHTVTQH